MKKSLFETILGAVVLAVAGYFFWFAYQTSEVRAERGYTIIAKFDNVDGIGVGSDVRLGGIKIGTVLDQELNADTYQAVLTLGIREDIRLPEDSTAAIVSSGLLGSKFVDLSPGAADLMLTGGQEIAFTQSSVNLESLIGKFMFSDGGVDGEESTKKSPSSDADEDAFSF